VDAQDMPVGDTPLAGLHLLLVEDHELNRHVIAEQLRRWGAEVCAVPMRPAPWPNRRGSPRRDLLDIGSGMDGHALARSCAGQPGAPLRLIALSARTGRRHRARCQSSGSTPC
jgi:two-component system sensor histidine kinase EvgS